MNLTQTYLPRKIFLLGYGAVGKCFAEILLKNHKNANLVVFDTLEQNTRDDRFQFIKKKLNRDNLHELAENLKEGDALIDLSTNIDVTAIWSMCMKRGVSYMNTAMEEWDDALDPNSFPKNEEEMYRTSLLYRHDKIEQSPMFNPKQGTTSVFEHGMNPGMISHLTKMGLEHAAEYFKTRKDWTDLNHDLIVKYSKEKNYPKLAQVMGLHTIHCSETDNQYVMNSIKDYQTKFYNTWSCRGFLTEGLIPIQVACGSHEDKESKELPRIKNGKVIMSKKPSRFYWAKSWVPFHNIEGVIIPHGEAYTIREFFYDKDTGYAPSQYYVYDFNHYAKEFIRRLPHNANIQNTNPEMEVLNPMKHEIRGYDKIGALLLFDKNRGWWCGSIMDHFDASNHLDFKFGPTILQVAGGVYAGFQWVINNPNAGNRWPEQVDSQYVLNQARPYLGRILSDYVDLNDTSIKDCYKFESFLTTNKLLINI